MTGKRVLLVMVAVIGVAGSVGADPGGWKQVGNAGDWKGTLVGVTLKNRIYTAESNGGLYVTDPATGAWKQLGKAEFGNTKFMFAVGNGLTTIETDGSLYQVNPDDGSWKQVGKAGDWAGTLAGTTLNDRIYTAETNGGLYETNPATGEWKQIGKAEFGNTTFMFAAGESLYTIETDGSLYRVSPADGSWVQLGNAGEWKATIVGVTVDNLIYSTETNGGLYVTDPATGTWKQLGKAEFGNTKFMFSGHGKLYSIETDGSLYEVYVK